MDTADVPTSMFPSRDVSLDDSDTPPRLGRLTRDIFLHPARAMRALAAHPDRRWLAPLAAAVAVSALAAIVALPATRQYQESVMRAQLARSAPVMPEGQSVDDMVALTTTGPLGMVTGAVTVIGALIGPILAALALAAVLHLLGTVVGGQQTYTQMFTLVSWARVPLIAGGLLWLAYVATGHFDPNPDGLSGLVAVDPLAGEGQASFAQPVLAQIEIWNLWSVALLALAVRAASRVSLGKAAVVVAVLVVLEVALGLAGVSVGRMFSGAFG